MHNYEKESGAQLLAVPAGYVIEDLGNGPTDQLSVVSKMYLILKLHGTNNTLWLLPFFDLG